jgi:sigma-70-like protein
VDTDSADVIYSPGTPLDRDVPAVTPGAAESAHSVTELFTEYHLGLVRLALLMVGELATAEDVVQDAFEQLYRRWRSLTWQRSESLTNDNTVMEGVRLLDTATPGDNLMDERQQRGAVPRPDRPVRPRPVRPVRPAGHRPRAVHSRAGLLARPGRLRGSLVTG